MGILECFLLDELVEFLHESIASWFGKGAQLLGVLGRVLLGGTGALLGLQLVLRPECCLHCFFGRFMG